jgi:spore maturation protein CgeB
VQPPLRVAYVASRWDYGDPARGPSFEEVNFRSALEGAGHDVHAYDFMTRFQAIGRTEMNAEVQRFVLEVEPDLAMFVLFKDEIQPETIRRLTDDGIVTFNWFCDDHWRFDDFSRHYAPAFTLVATTHPESVPRYHASGYDRVVLSQWACNHYAYDRQGLEPAHDVTFVGQRYGDRPQTVRALRKAGINVRCWGQGWGNGRIEHDEMVRIFETSRINLNLSNSWTGRWWRRRAPVSQIKARVFEVPGCGGFLLTEAVPHVEDYFAVGSELATFEGTSDLIEKITYWLNYEDERAHAAERGYARVRAEHTYDHRFNQIFGAAGLRGA